MLRSTNENSWTTFLALILLACWVCAMLTLFVDTCFYDLFADGMDMASSKMQTSKRLHRTRIKSAFGITAGFLRSGLGWG
jgi:hypothetical protein